MMRRLEALSHNIESDVTDKSGDDGDHQIIQSEYVPHSFQY